MIYRGTQLLDSVQQKITNSLQQRVKLIGEIKYDQIEAYFNAADIFVQGSNKEGSGIAILDAMACGCIPVITKIPSFIKLTDNSSVGKLWSIGNSDDFCDSLIEIMQRDLSHEQENCRSLFQNTWTFDVITKKSMSYYFDLQG
jgi:glycosyltransferase involved in cell wall biosynthesis